MWKINTRAKCDWTAKGQCPTQNVENAKALRKNGEI